MNRTRLWTIGSVLLMVLILAGGYVLGVQPQLAAASTSDQDRLNQEAQNAVLATDLNALKTQFESIDDVRAELADIRLEIPQAADLDDLIDQLSVFASESGVTITDYVAGEATVFVPSVDGAVEQAEEPVANADPSASQFVTLPIDITLEGNYDSLLSFLNSAQLGKRLFLAYGVDVSNDEEDANKYVLKVSGFAYVVTGADGAADDLASEDVPTDDESIDPESTVSE
jgi:Tfp pilus assembly protein PilO